MLGVTLLDARDRPIRPALLWNDGRAGAECLDLLSRVPDFVDRVGCRPMPGFSAPKILWLSHHEPEAIERTRKILLPKDYVRLCLSGEAVTDLADGSATSLMETRAGKWSDDIAQACGISTERLPRLIDSDAVSAELRPELARRWNLRTGLPIAAAPATTCAVRSEPASCKQWRCLHQPWHLGRIFRGERQEFVPARGKGMHTHRHAIQDVFAQHGCVLSAAAALSWLTDLLKIKSVEAIFD